MSEIIYKLFFFMMLVIFFSVGFLIKLKLDYWKNYHGLDFVGIDAGFKISTGGINFKKKDVIYVNKVPQECKNNNKNSIKCLAALKKQTGVYNGLSFFSGTNAYR